MLTVAPAGNPRHHAPEFFSAAMPETVSFEHYEVLTRDDGSLYELGRGAMGVTYKAFDTSLKVPVALKVINAAYLDSEVARQRFVREAQSAAKLRHRNVATVYHLGTEGEAWFYAMEFIDGETVDALVKRHGPLDPVLALQIAAQVARALNAAMSHALVHRDIKPANLMLIREDEELVVKVIDFGLALSSRADEEEARRGSFVGTPHFASPEQLRNGDLDVRSDIYSLGVTLWFMLAARTPFTGTIEQVKKLHLTQPPPFEQFKDLPAPAAAVLAKALEKEAARRHQTPQEFRRAVEECVEQISGSSAQAAGDDDEQLTHLLDEAQQRPGESQFEPHAVVAGRYKIVEATGETNTGRTFRCYDRERQRDVRLLVLNQDLATSSAAYTQIEREVEKIALVQHENLLGVHDFEAIDGASFLIMEWTEGFTVLELLRARRELEATETLALLEPAARGVDYALAAGLKCIDFALHQIAIHFNQSVDKEKLLRAPLLTWPPFTVKLNPLGVTYELSASETWAGGQTMVHGAPSLPANTDARARYVQALGVIAYELLGGAISPLPSASSSFGASSGRYTPLSTLSEEGNEVLKRALNPAASFASAEEFLAALKNLHVLEVRPADRKLAAGSGTHHSTTALDLTNRTRTATTHAASKTTRIEPKGGTRPWKILGGFITVAALGAGVYFLAPRTPPRPPDEGGLEEKPVAGEVKTGAPPEPVVETVKIPAEPEPQPMKPAPQPENPLPPTREEKLQTALIAAHAVEKDGEPAEAIAGWLGVAHDFPESDTPRTRLEFIITALRERDEIKKPAAFKELKPLLVQAAQLDVLAAVLLLAEGEHDRHPKESFDWYSYAAANGRVDAYLEMGLLLSNGLDGPPDLEMALACFTLAAEGDVADAKMALGECYLFGKGTKKDYAVGVKWLKEAAAQNNLRAMNRLADGYDHGFFNLPIDYKEAFRLWSQVVEYKNRTGDFRQPVGEAHCNLGILYINGHGTKPDLKRALELFRTGMNLGDANAMYMVGLFTYDGRGGVTKDQREGRRLIKRAAALHSKAALGWWQTHGDEPGD
jgi:serine/threonine protein kinase/TPR repeat protein